MYGLDEKQSEFFFFCKIDGEQLDPNMTTSDRLKIPTVCA